MRLCIRRPAHGLSVTQAYLKLCLPQQYEAGTLKNSPQHTRCPGLTLPWEERYVIREAFFGFIYKS